MVTESETIHNNVLSRKFIFFRKLIAIFFALAFSFCVLACSSESGFKIPGEKKIVFSNISIEYFSIANAYFDLKNYSKAAEYYKLACRNEDLKIPAYYKMAQSYALASDWENAENAYERLLALDKENTDLRASLAYIFAMSGKLEKAEKTYQEIIEKNPFDQSNSENYLNVLLAEEKNEQAKSFFQTYKMTFPDSLQIAVFSAKFADADETESFEIVDSPQDSDFQLVDAPNFDNDAGNQPPSESTEETQTDISE